MAVVIKPGARRRSATCATEVVIVKGPQGEIDLRCGGQSMADIASEVEQSSPAAPFDEGTQVGKRYVDGDDSIEVLCTKAGAGSLSIGDAVLQVKGAKPLPSSD